MGGGAGWWLMVTYLLIGWRHYDVTGLRHNTTSWPGSPVFSILSGDVDSRRRQRNVYDKKPQRYAKDNRTVHLIARSYKSVAYVTNNKRLYSTFCTVKAIYTDRHEASRGLFAKAELLVKSRFSYWQSKYHDVEILDHSNSNSLEMAPFDTSSYSIVFHC